MFMLRLKLGSELVPRAVLSVAERMLFVLLPLSELSSPFFFFSVVALDFLLLFS